MRTITFKVGPTRCDPVHAFLQTMMEWLVQHQFAGSDVRPWRVDTENGRPSAYIEFFHQVHSPGAPMIHHQVEVWHLYYDSGITGPLDQKRLTDNCIVLGKVDVTRFASPYQYTDQLFHCRLEDPNLWERTLEALMAFSYANWPVIRIRKHPQDLAGWAELAQQIAGPSLRAWGGAEGRG